MTTFNPFSAEGKKWLEEHQVEDQFNSLENIGLSRTKSHSKSKMDINSDTNENMDNEKNNKYENKKDSDFSVEVDIVDDVGIGCCCRCLC